MTSPLPVARLSVFRSRGGSGESDVAFVSRLLGIESMPGYSRGSWVISTEGRVASRSVTDHVDELLRGLAGKFDALKRLRAEGYWVCVFFHDTRLPDPLEQSTVTAALEEHDITFDFELERE